VCIIIKVKARKGQLKFFILWNVSKQILMLGDRKPVPPPYIYEINHGSQNVLGVLTWFGV
jgi:hypothetical protein